MANLFDKAKKSAPAKATKAKDEKLRIKIDDIQVFESIKDVKEGKMVIDRTQTMVDAKCDEIKELSKDKWAELYEKIGKNPGSVMIEAEGPNGEIAQVMFVPSDKYITITEERADQLVETFGEDIVEENCTFEFDKAMIEKYGDILSRLIEESDEIKDADKDKIIKAKRTFSVAKGTIDKLDKYGDVSEIIEQIKPVVALKGFDVING
jgi:hypothetical protein